MNPFGKFLTATLLIPFLGSALFAAAIRPVDLSSAANTAFADEKADDRRGGWTDQGTNDLRVLTPGSLDAGGVPFTILSDRETDGKSCIVLGDGKKRDYLPRTAELEFTTPVTGKVLYLLNGSAWSGKSGSVSGRLTVTYTDGKSQEFRVRAGRDTADWWGSSSYSNAVRVWSKYNNNSQVSLYVSKFRLDDKPLKSIRFAAEEAVWMIAAASIGDDVQPRAIRKSWTLVRNYPAPPPVDAAELAARPQTGTPRNIIMIIGDGMGQGAQRLASLHAHGEPGRLVMEQLPAAGLALTHSANNSVTDSAASGTALSSGYKTNNGMVGVAPDKSKRNSIAEAARDSGRSVGIITTDSLTGATPGAYLAHVEHRGMTEAIADFASKSGFDILTGSDAGPFLPRNAGGKRGDGRDIFAELRQAGYREANDPATLSGLPAGKVYGTVNNWLSDTELLSKYAAAAFERLNANPRGFFVMVECSYPDYGGHGNNPELSTQGVLMADFLVRAALDFAGKRNDTLVVVTADHETGGISAAPNRGNPKRPFLYYTTTNHTGTPVAIFACGPGANRFAGVLDNTDIPTTLAGLWNLRIGEKISE